jgi:cytochrome c oxidase subunit 2
VPGDAGRVDPMKLAETVPFNEPGVVEIAPGHYGARIVAGIWLFTPNEIRVPAGATETFVATSRDV